MADNAGAIVAFLRGKGLSDNAIAGVLGNLQVESGLSPTAFNANENAIGIAQWEGGRRTALQNYAKQHGGSEQDLGTQLGYLWQELSGPYSGALNNLKTVGDAASAAAIFDQQFEGSAGTSRGQRVSAAQSFLASGLKAGAIPATAGASSTQLAGTGTAGSTAPTEVDLKAALGSLSGLLTAVPELKDLLNKAVSGGWAVTKFQQAVEGSNWYRTHSDRVRSNIALSVSDPATYRNNLQNIYNQITNAAQSMGFNLTTQQLKDLGSGMLNSGWDAATLQKNIGQYWAMDTKGGTQTSGQGAGVRGQVQALYSDYGVPATSDLLALWTQQILQGTNTLDGVKNGVVNAAKSMWAGAASQISSTMTTRQIADPYIQAKAQLLETAPNTIDWAKDTSIQQAIQGTAAPGTTDRVATPLWKFQQQVRTDPRWGQTQNAKDTMSTALLHIGANFGFGPTG